MIQRIFILTIAALIALGVTSSYAETNEKLTSIKFKILAQPGDKIPENIKKIIKTKIISDNFTCSKNLNKLGYKLTLTEDDYEADVRLAMMGYDDDNVIFSISSYITDDRFAEFAKKLDNRAKADPVFKVLSSLTQHRRSSSEWGRITLVFGGEKTAVVLLGYAIKFVEKLGYPKLIPYSLPYMCE